MFGDVLVDQTSFGHTVTYICKQGYIISGTTERTCSFDGTWTGTKPVCTVSGMCSYFGFLCVYSKQIFSLTFQRIGRAIVLTQASHFGFWIQVSISKTTEGNKLKLHMIVLSVII
jgi:hypothetical protein